MKKWIILFFVSSVMVITASEREKLSRAVSSKTQAQLAVPLMPLGSYESASMPSASLTKEQKLQAYDKELENCYQNASVDQQKKQAYIIQQHDPNESCVECSCCCFWRSSYKAQFEGLAKKLFTSSYGYEAFDVPQFQADCRRQRFLSHVRGTISQYTYEGCIKYLPEDLCEPSLDGVYPIHALVGTADREDIWTTLGYVPQYFESEYRTDVLRAALTKKVDVCVRDAQGNTPLMLVASRSLPMTKVLVEYMKRNGISVQDRVNDTNDEGETALIQVAQAVHKGAIPQYEWKKHWVSKARVENRALYTSQYLLGVGADPKATDQKSNSFESLASADIYLKAVLALHENPLLKRALQAGQAPQEEKMPN